MDDFRLLDEIRHLLFKWGGKKALLQPVFLKKIKKKLFFQFCHKICREYVCWKKKKHQLL